MKKYFLLASLLMFQAPYFAAQPASTFDTTQISEVLQKLSSAELEMLIMQAQEEHSAQLNTDNCFIAGTVILSLATITFCLVAQPYFCGQLVDCFVNCSPEAIQSFAQRVWCVAHCNYPTH
ncbi:hypothetical protein K2W90_00150 [Candidatus Babeliales bacterium]|nr:hypothetical protein [Candidatus Babeliales bacterium]